MADSFQDRPIVINNTLDATTALIKYCYIGKLFTVFTTINKRIMSLELSVLV